MEKENKKYKFTIHDPLHELDTAEQTYGCRCNNPDICKHCYDKTCALSNDTHICTTPSRAWKKVYLEKVEKEKTEKK